jgi:hypothetical protein
MGEAIEGKGAHHQLLWNGLEGGCGKVLGERFAFVWIARVDINMERLGGGMVGDLVC